MKPTETDILEKIQDNPNTARIQLALVLVLLVVAWFLGSIYLAYLAVAVGVVSLIPYTGNRMVLVLIRLKSYLSGMLGNGLLTVLYYLVVTPVGFVYRLIGNDPLLVKDNKKSVYTFREQTFKKADMEDPG